MVTEIPWGDGSGDKIYLTYDASTGDQTILVSSDANNYTERTKDIIFTSGVGSITRVLTVTQEAGSNYVSITFNDTCITFDDVAIAYPEGYIIFADPVVEQICATNWGDGVGLTPSQAAQVTNAQFGATFRGNTDIESFDEFKYFTGITALTQASNQGAFYNCTSLKSVYTPPSLHSLVGGEGVFRGCSSLEEVHFGGHISVGNTWYAFSGCSSLTKCYFENSSDLWSSSFYTASNNTYCYQPFHVSGSGHYYIGDTEVTSLIVPKELTTINGSLFYNCKYITSLSFEAQSACTTISAYAFYGCSGIIGTVIIPPSVTNINASAFEDCTEITSISLPANVTLGLGAFRRCTSLQTVTLNGSFTTSGANCFYYDTVVNTLNISSLNDYCASTINATRGTPTASANSGVSVYELGSGNEITTLPLPSTMTVIPSNMFRRWWHITSVTLPQNITSIGNYAFLGCTSLTGSIVLPSTFTSMGEQAFRYCSGITDFIFNSTVQLDTSAVWGAGNSTGDFYAAGDVLTGAASAVNGFQKIQIDGDVIHNGNRALGGAVEIRIGGNVRELNSYAGHVIKNGGPLLKFLEIGGTIVLSQGKLIVNNENLDATESIMHLKYNGIACTPDIACASYARLTKIYVDSQAVLDQYLADSDWSQYSTKLDLWSNYNGPYKN